MNKVFNHFRTFVSSSKSGVIFAAAFFVYFLVLCPLGTFSSWIPQGFQKGYYSLIQIDSADDANWFGLTRSFVMDGDIDLANEEFFLKNPEGQIYRKGGFYYAKFLTRTGYNYVMPYGFGVAMLWAPFLFVGHHVTTLLQTMGVATALGVETLPGYHYPDLVFVALAGMFFLFLGLLICQRVFSQYFSEKSSWLATAAVFFCSELPYFTFIRNRMLHATEFFAMALAFLCWDRVYRQKKNTIFDSLLMGFAFGFLALCRLNSALYFILPAGLLLFRFVENLRKNTGQNKRATVLVDVGEGLAVIGAFLIALAPFFFILKVVYGGFFDVSASMKYLREAGQEWIPFVSPGEISLLNTKEVSFFDRVAIPKQFRYIYLFFSPYWGLVWTTPMVLFGLLGLGLHFRKDRLRVGLFLLALIPTWHWFQTWPGSAFGHRYMLPLFVFYGFGFAALADWVSARWRKRGFFVLSGLVVLMAFWNYILLIQHEVSVAYNDPQFCLTALKNFFTNEKPFSFFRTTSFFSLLLDLGRFRINSGLDFFMLLLTPMVLMFLLGFALIFRFVPFEWNLCRQRRLCVVLLVLSVSVCATIVARNPPLSTSEKINRFVSRGTELVQFWPAPLRHHLTGVLLGRYALEIDPKSEKARAFFQQANLHLAQQYARKGDFNQAANFYRRIEPFFQTPEDRQKYLTGLRELERNAGPKP